MTSDWKTFTCRYYHDSQWWSLDIIARDFADAEARVNKLGNLQLLGEVQMRIPARVPASNLLVRLWVWLNNKLTSSH